jgi:hypothetical protein
MSEREPSRQDAQGYGIAQADHGSIAVVNIGPSSARRRSVLWPALIVVIIISLVGWAGYRLHHRAQPPPEQKLKGVAGEWLYDGYVAVLIPKGSVGTLLAEGNYELELDLKNRTSMPLEVTKIEVEKYNHEAALIFGLTTDRVHTSTSNVPQEIEADGEAKVSIVGNQILPERAIVKVYHTLSGVPSAFEVDLGAKRMPMPSPRQLNVRTIYRGTDGLKPIATAAKVAAAWGENITIVAAFPGDHEIFIDPDSRLKFVAVKDWVVTFYSFTLNELYTAIVKGDKVEGRHYTKSEGDLDLPEKRVELPRIGNQQALAIANQENLLCADWKEDRALIRLTLRVSGLPLGFCPIVARIRSLSSSMRLLVI